MSDWIKEAAEEIVIEWPRIDAEAGERAQCEQDSFAGHAVSVDAITAIIERRWEESLTDAKPVDFGALLDQRRMKSAGCVRTMIVSSGSGRRLITMQSWLRRPCST